MPRLKRLLMCFVLFALLIGQVSAGHNVDNNLESLYTAKKAAWAVQVDGGYPQTSYDFIYISPDKVRDDMTFTVSKPDNIAQAYLYIFTSGNDCTCEVWNVKFNGNTLASGEHSISIGPNPDGDGEPTKELQTIRFAVDGSDINDGSNILDFLLIQGYRHDQINIHGAVLVTFYKVPNDHEIWVYDGVEYLNHKLVVDDYFYSEEFPNSTYPVGSKATLTTVLHNPEIPEDALYFNNALLADENATYLFGSDSSSFLTAKRFNVTDYLDQNDLVNFTYLYYTPPGETLRMYNGDYPLYPSLVILDVDLQDSPPAVNFTSPANNTAISAGSTVDINFTVDDTEAAIEMRIDGATVTPSETSPGEWTYPWNLTGVSPGLHNLTVYATDPTDNRGSDTIFLNVIKPAPKVSFINPANGTLLSKKSNVAITLSVDDPDAAVTISIDSVKVSNSSSYDWDLSEVEPGLHRISATATDSLEQTGEETVTVNVTTEDVATTTTSTTLSNGETTTTTTLPPTTPPPQTSPPVTTPPIPKVELAINSLTLSTGASTIEKGTDVTAFVLASNSGDTAVDATIALYIDEELIESKTSSLNAYETEEREIFIRGGRLLPGSHTMKAKIIVQGMAVEERDLTNNERTIEISVEEKTDLINMVTPYLKWIAIIVVLIVVAKAVITFIMEREEDYLR